VFFLTDIILSGDSISSPKSPEKAIDRPLPFADNESKGPAMGKRTKNSKTPHGKEIYQLLVQNGLDGMYIVTSAGFEYVNPAFAKLVGFSAEEICNTSFNIFDLVHPADKKLITERKDAREKQKALPSIYQFRIISKDGSIKHVEVNTVPLPGKKGRTLGILRDITDRKRAEDALLVKNAQFQSLIQAIPDIVYFKDANRLNLIINKAFEKAFHLEAAKIIGKTDEEFLPQDLADSCRASDEVVLRNGKPYRFQEKAAAPGGSIIVFETIKAPIFDAKGKTVGLVGVSRDITERKCAEDELRAALREKDVLLKEIHHRVKNNMQVISSLLNLQARYIKDPEVLEIFKESQRRIRSMALIHEKLYTSRSLSQIEFSSYLRSLASTLFSSLQISPSQVELKTDLEELSFDINTAIPCGLIVNELVSNSLKHAFPGARHGEILLRLRRAAGNEYLMSVRDNGVGFPDHIDFRETESLGMQLVNMLVDQIEGRIEIEKKAGTEFRVYFKEPKYRPRI
jgi:PAS domain S-box-containing protein